MQSPALQAGKGAQAGRFATVVPNQASKRRVFSMDRRKRSSEIGLEEALSTALLSADGELGHIVHEVDAITKSLRSDVADPQSHRVAAHPAVWSAIKQALLDRELRYLALTDDLTCLFNRRGFFAAATQQLKLAHRNGHGLLLFFCDVDNLKKINDCYGHQEGDLALIHAADALEETFRASDVLARIGGDEFVALAVQSFEIDQELIVRRLEKILKKSNPNEALYELSFSVGVARFDPKCPTSLGELIAQADKAMYEQKRNRPVSCVSKS
jgi:diguanylate cyclase (GGDEF)-like protein